MNLHLTGGIDEVAFGVKNTELRDRIAALTLQLEASDRQKLEKADFALKVFELAKAFKASGLPPTSPKSERSLIWCV